MIRNIKFEEEYYRRNLKLEQEDANKVRFGEISKSEFTRNMNNGKYR